MSIKLRASIDSGSRIIGIKQGTERKVCQDRPNLGLAGWYGLWHKPEVESLEFNVGIPANSDLSRIL